MAGFHAPIAGWFCAPADTDRHGQLVDGHFLPKDFEKFLLGWLVPKGVFGKARIVRIEQKPVYCNPLVGLSLVCRLCYLRFGHRYTRPIRLSSLRA